MRLQRLGGLLIGISSLAIVVSACKKQEMMTGGVEYMVTFSGMWTAQNFPFEYPAAGVVTGPHFSGLIGATHDGSYMLFKEGMMPTMGLEKLSEEGKHSPLDEEIKAAMAAGKVGMLFESGPIKDMNAPAMTTVRVDEKHAMVSAVAMIAPSPDWFVGVADVNLMENGNWVDSKEVMMMAYDSGGDDGTTYTAPDKDNNPKKPTSKASMAHFMVNGQHPAVAKLMFKKK